MNNSKEEALKNIEVKINILKSWLNNEIPFRCDEEGHQLLDDKGNKIIDYVPVSVRQFCGWNGTQNCEFNRKSFPSIRTLNNSTLAQHKRHRMEVEKLAAALNEKVKLQQQRTSTSEIKRYKTAQCEMKINLCNGIDENLILRRDFKAIEKKYKELLCSTQGHEQNFAKTYQSMEQEIERLKAKVSELTKTLSKIYPLSIHGDK